MKSPPKLYSIYCGPQNLRYEFKMTCDPQWLPQVHTWIRLHPAGFSRTYPPRRINNIYLDSPHLTSLADNLAGLSERRKLRLRWYGHSTSTVEPVLELKQKLNLLGTKYRTPLLDRLDLTLLWSDILRTLRASVTPGWQVILAAATQPTLLNTYSREYYATHDGEVRITIDYKQAAYDQRLTPRPNFQNPLPLSDQIVVEIKAPETRAERLQQIAGQFPIQRTRNSKYCSGLRAAPG